jgi:hypothetical protein
VVASDAFAVRYANEHTQTKSPHFVTLDNSSIHHRKVFLPRLDD